MVGVGGIWEADGGWKLGVTFAVFDLYCCVRWGSSYLVAVVDDGCGKIIFKIMQIRLGIKNVQTQR